MKKLKHSHLIDLELKVDFKNMLTIGKTSGGFRQIAPITGGKFTGEKLKGTVLYGHDWVLHQRSGGMIIDVRPALETDDGAHIYKQYQGHFVADPAAMAEMANGVVLDPSRYTLAMTAKFECGDERYSWVNSIVTVGTGTHGATGPLYAIFRIG